MTFVNQIFLLLQAFWIALKSGQLPELGFWNYIFLALLVAIEGPIATLLGAAAASAGLMKPWSVFVAASCGNLAADSLWYSLGRAGKIKWLLHWGHWFGLRPHHLERLQQAMHDHAVKVLLVAKLTVSIVIPSLIAAGLARVPWRKWFPPIFIGEMIWTGVLVTAGYFATEGIKRVEREVEYSALAVSSLLAVFLLHWLISKVLRPKAEVDINPTAEDAE